jgi:serine/threonine-protein kinase
LVGKLKSFNGEGALYIGFDTITQTKVLVKEYMPDTLCSREKDGEVLQVNPNYVAQYKTFLSDFVELNKALTKMRSLNHINAAVDMFGANNTGYVVFPLTEGVTLGEYLRNNAGELTVDEVKKLFPPLFTTLSLVHNAGVIHRGISPEVITVNEKGELKLQGYGFCISDARTANTELASELFSGYAAPEQYNSANWQGTQTDVYGISALLYKTLTGITPADAAGRMVNDSLLEPALVNRNIPPNISKTIMNGLHIYGEMRAQTITELVTQLFEQPEDNAARLSSSSTQTITIPTKAIQNASAAAVRRAPPRTPPPTRKTRRVSRKSLFLTAGGVTLFIGMFSFILMLFALNGGGVKDGSQSALTGIADSGVNAPVTSATIATIRETSPPQTSQTLQAAYIMNDVTGKLFEVVKNSSAYVYLNFTDMHEFNDEVGRGVIFWQSIAEGDSYAAGAEIIVKVSKGPQFIPVPDYIGLNKREYFALLNAAGIKYEEREFETDSVLEGYVVKLGVLSDGKETDKEPDDTIDAEKGETLIVFTALNPLPTETQTAQPPPFEFPPFVVFPNGQDDHWDYWTVDGLS